MSERFDGDRAVRAIADSAYVRAAGHIVSIIGVPVISYLMFSLLTLRTDVTSLQGDIKRIDDAMLLRTQLRYTSEDAKRDLSGVDFRLDDLSHRVDTLEKR